MLAWGRWVSDPFEGVSAMRMVWVRLIGCRPLARGSGRQRLTLRVAGVAFALAVVVPAALQVQTAMAVSVPRIYWGNDATNAIVAANLDGTNPNPNFAAGAQNPGGLAVDGQHVYWSNFVTGTIGRANLNGTGVDPNFITGLGHVEDVAVNDQHVYWADAVAGTIGEADLNGTDVNQSFITGANNPHGVAVDGQHIYWSDGDTNTIGEANLDGTDVNQSFITGASFPTMVRVDGQHIYWINFNLDTIGEANLDGSDVNEGFIGGANEAGLAVDGQHIYWDSSASTIGRANQDGTGVNQSFITTATFVAGLAVSVPIAQVTPTRPAGVRVHAGGGAQPTTDPDDHQRGPARSVAIGSVVQRRGSWRFHRRRQRLSGAGRTCRELPADRRFRPPGRRVPFGDASDCYQRLCQLPTAGTAVRRPDQVDQTSRRVPKDRARCLQDGHQNDQNAWPQAQDDDAEVLDPPGIARTHNPQRQPRCACRARRCHVRHRGCGVEGSRSPAALAQTPHPQT